MSKRLLCILFLINKKHTKMKKILILFLSSLVIISCGEKQSKSTNTGLGHTVKPAAAIKPAAAVEKDGLSAYDP